MDRQFTLSQVQLYNYKNIAAAVVDLRPLTVLVGPNGAGKSNFVDALAFVADSLDHSLHLAFAQRGGVAAVRRRSATQSAQLGIRLHLSLADSGWADYAFAIAEQRGEAFFVARERCVVAPLGQPTHVFEVENGRFIREVPGIRARVESDRLALTVLSAAEEYRPVYDFLTGIRRYLLRPEHLRELQDVSPSDSGMLWPDGSNAALILQRLSEERNRNGHVYERICRLLGQVVPGITSVRPKLLGERATLEFSQAAGAQQSYRFDALSMSDGTLRALGILLAVYQPRPASLIIIEEPEATIHPAAVEVLLDILRDGTARSQILLTTHSPDVLDCKELSEEQIIAVESVDGIARMTPLSAATRTIIRQHLYTPGELLRAGELQPDAAYAELTAGQVDPFGAVGGA